MRSREKPRQLQFTAKSNAEGRAALTENSEDLQRIPLKLRNGHCMYVKNYLRLEKEPTDRVGGNNVRSSPSAKNSLFPTTRVENLITWASVRVLTSLFSVVGIT